MRVVLAIKSLEGKGGGAERVLVDVANGLVARGHHVAVVTFDHEDAQTFYQLDSRVILVGVAIGRPGLPTPRVRFLASMLRLRRVVKAQKPDVVMGFMHSTYVPLALATLGAGLRKVASEHAGLVHFRGRRMERWLVRATGPCFLLKTVPAARLRDEYPERERRNITVLANPVDLDQFAAARMTTEGQAPVLLCVGGFREEKEHATLLKSFAQIADIFPDWTLRLIGDGPLRAELETLVTQLGLDRQVEMPGVSANVAAEYARAAAVVVPSRHESFGLVAVEALASARPVIGFVDALGPLEIAVDGHNALLVEDTGERVHRLAEGLRTLLADVDLRMRLGQAGPASVQRFAREAVVSEWEALLRGCTGVL